MIPSPSVPRRSAPERSTVLADTDAPDLDRLRSALAAIPNDGEGIDYEQWHKVIAGVHHATGGSDTGLALCHEFGQRSSKHDPEFLDARVWQYLRSDRDGGVITTGTIFGLAAAAGWVDPLILDDFDAVDAPQNEKKNRYEFVDDTDFAAGKPPSWLIRDVLPQAELGVIFGASGSGKSFFALDLAGSIAQGLDWRGKKTTQARVGFIAAEGASGFRNRINAYCRHNDMPSMGIKVLAAAPNFMERKDINDVIGAVKDAGHLDLVFVDTLAQVTPGANENSGEDMGRAIAHCGLLHAQTGAMVVLIHHSGKDSAKGARGWSGIKGALNVEIEILRADQDRVAVVTKMKDGTGEGDEYGFRLDTVVLSEDPLGEEEEVSSCVVTPTETGAKNVRATRPKGPIEIMLCGIWRDLYLAAGAPPDDGEVLAEYLNRVPRDADSKTDRRPERSKSSLRGMVKRGLWPPEVGKTDENM
jgi:hypothetical protein